MSNLRTRLYPALVSHPDFGALFLTLCTALFVVLLDNRLLWHMFAQRLGLDTLQHWKFAFILGAILVLLFSIIITLVAFRTLLKPFLVILLLISAGVSYFSDSFGVVIDKTMVINILETDVREASELMTWALLWHLFVYGCLPALLVIMAPLRYPSWRRSLLLRTGSVLAGLVIIAALGILEYKEIVLFGRTNNDLQVFINPSYPIYAFNKVLYRKHFAQTEQPLQIIAADAAREQGTAREIVVLVVGETARSSEFPGNGYGRNTTPYMDRNEVIDFTDVAACGTSTAESVPCMFSSLDKDHFSRNKAGERENLLDILQRTGVHVVWRDNNSSSKGVADRVPYENYLHRKDVGICSDDNCYDEVLLQGLDDFISTTPGDLLVVLHLKGSHGPSYYKRSPEALKAFKPECAIDNVQDCSQQALVNAYDNTIVYTDYVLAKLVDLLKEQSADTAMLYLSDHGESLGENGIYLHGLPYMLAPAEQTHVPMTLWMSDSFLADQQIDKAALIAKRDRHFSHDNLFHSLLGLYHVNTAVYDRNLDIFSDAHGGHHI